ncbi:hypothetical protein [Bacillus cereus]|uniref:hypothetical protein n=1 Tax=Bacillus cereus TaxID=1396 RepID=UPI000BF83763|nr:hypothetical protein [Bacillus cereus]PFC61612.1 hypothetical protein CN267_11140 [Bacillus cereus]
MYLPWECESCGHKELGGMFDTFIECPECGGLINARLDGDLYIECEMLACTYERVIDIQEVIDNE